MLRVLPFPAGLPNANGILFALQPGAFFLAVVRALLLGAVVFMRMVFVRPAL